MLFSNRNMFQKVVHSSYGTETRIGAQEPRSMRKARPVHKVQKDVHQLMINSLIHPSPLQKIIDHQLSIFDFCSDVAATQPRGHTATQLHSYIAIHPQSHIATQLHSHERRWPPVLKGGGRPSAALWLCSNYVAMSLCGCVAVWPCVYSGFCVHPAPGGRLLMSRSHVFKVLFDLNTFQDALDLI